MELEKVYKSDMYTLGNHGCPWFTPIILATQEAEIKRTEV
jgi:hypothetical protein